MKLIIGLGNPGKEYENTRHNIGFMILDRLQEIAHFSDFKISERFSALIAEKTDTAGEKILLVKPQLFMNRSGEIIKRIMNFYHVPLENISVVHDDLDIELGQYKKATDSSAAGHNGVQDIVDQLGTQKFIRYRVGIEGAEKRKDRVMLGDAFVLQKFSEEELRTLQLTEGFLKDIGIAGAIAFDLGL